MYELKKAPPTSDDPKLAYKVVTKTRPQIARELGMTVKQIAKLERQLARQGKAYRSADGTALWVRTPEHDPPATP